MEYPDFSFEEIIDSSLFYENVCLLSLFFLKILKSEQKFIEFR